MGKSSQSADVIGAARETGEQARWLQREQTLANRPNQYNPWGSTRWYRGSGAGQDWGGGQYAGQPEVPQPPVKPGPDAGPGGVQPAPPAMPHISAKAGDGEIPGLPPGWPNPNEPPPNTPVRPPAEPGLPPGFPGIPGVPGGQPGIPGVPGTRPIPGIGEPGLPPGTPSGDPGTGMPGSPGVGEPGGPKPPSNPDGSSPGAAGPGGGSNAPQSGNLPSMQQWTQIERLHPDLERALYAQFGQQAGRSELAQSMLGGLYDTMGTPHDFDQYGDPIQYDSAQKRQEAEDAAYGRATARLDPQFQQQQQALEVQLRNRGLRPGDQAYESEMDRFNRSKADAYEQARRGATAEGRQETQLGMSQNQLANQLRTQKIQEDLRARGYTLEEINALMQGQEVQGGSPSMGNNQTIADILRGGLGGGR